MPVTLANLQNRDSYLTFSGISWSQMEAIEAAFDNVAGVRFTYLDGILEIITISPEHEETKSTIGLLVETYMRAKRAAASIN